MLLSEWLPIGKMKIITHNINLLIQDTLKKDSTKKDDKESINNSDDI